MTAAHGRPSTLHLPDTGMTGFSNTEWIFRISDISPSNGADVAD